ncbi:hypothetical protein chiPu_0000145 [Chiloscyllium punctatum]|uniref:Uncharacterized protein n=1 Tax=Chiloscyllium punctatum TaxID=137246 RepID=A0A401RS48_CHIPU|nr:hypothetical protein [Chiloscyllium punctatum]
MVHSDMSKAQEIRMGILENPSMQMSGKGAIRKNRFKGSDGSTSSDTTSNSYVRQINCATIVRCNIRQQQ